MSGETISQRVYVKAVQDIFSDAGLLLAGKGSIGFVDQTLQPRREQHYGLIPICWSQHKRSFWIKYKLLRCYNPTTRRILPAVPVSKYVPEIPAKRAFTLELPDGDGNFHFGESFTKIRKARGLSQEELAGRMRKAGLLRISQTTISNWGSRVDSPSGPFLRAAAKALKVPACVFFMDLSCENVSQIMEFVEELQEAVCE
jgi:hypothetical protein